MPPARPSHRTLCGVAAVAAATALASSLAAQPAPAPERGTAGDDILLGTPGPDEIAGLAGADRIRGLDGPDTLNGNAGADTVGGGPGDDQVHGGRGDDHVSGGQGDDTVGGDAGRDTLVGGEGADLFLLRYGGGEDLIADFSSAAGDRIELPPDAAYTVIHGPGEVVIRLKGGEAAHLAGLTTQTLGEWLAAERPAPVRDASIPPPRAPGRALLSTIVVLTLAFFVLLAAGLYQLWAHPEGRRRAAEAGAGDAPPGRRRIGR